MFYKIISSINNNIRNKKKIILIKKNKKIINLLKFFIKINLIKFIKLKNNYIYINLNLQPINKNLIKLKNLNKISNIKYIKCKNIEKINKNNKLLIISSNKGVLDNYTALKKKTGGIIISYV